VCACARAAPAALSPSPYTQRREALKYTAANAKADAGGKMPPTPRATDGDGSEATRAEGSKGGSARQAVRSGGGGLTRRDSGAAFLAMVLGFFWGQGGEKREDPADEGLVKQTLKQEEEILLQLTDVKLQLSDVTAQLAAAAARQRIVGGEFSLGAGDDDHAPSQKEEGSALMEAALATVVAGILGVQGYFLKTEYDSVCQAYLQKGGEATVSSKATWSSKVTWSEVLGYRLDYYLSNNPLAKPLLLLNGTFLIILFGSIVLQVTQGQAQILKKILFRKNSFGSP
jgi:hypothetical protein